MLRGKSKFTHEAPNHAPDRPQEQPSYKTQVISILPPSLLWTYRPVEYFIPMKFPINEVFDAFKDKLWVRTQNRSSATPHSPGRRNIAPTTSVRDTKPTTVGPSEGTWRNSSKRASLRSTSSLHKRFLDSQPYILLGSRIRSPITKWSTEFSDSFHTVYILPILSLCSALFE